MATIGATYVDLIDGYRQTDENGATSVVIEVLKQFNPIMDDAVAVECSDIEVPSGERLRIAMHDADACCAHLGDKVHG